MNPHLAIRSSSSSTARERFLSTALATGNAVSNDDGDADCTIMMTLEDFQSIAAGSLDATSAYMQGKLKVEGDMGIAMKLQPLLSSLSG